MNREEMINQIMDLSGDEFKTREELIELAKESSYQLMNRLTIINEYILNEEK